MSVIFRKGGAYGEATVCSFPYILDILLRGGGTSSTGGKEGGVVVNAKKKFICA